jgi:hypothetical protein
MDLSGIHDLFKSSYVLRPSYFFNFNSNPIVMSIGFELTIFYIIAIPLCDDVPLDTRLSTIPFDCE